MGYFVTSNKNDFSDPFGNNNAPHPDLSSYFTKRKSRYFIVLNDALRYVNLKLVPDILFEQDMIYDEPRGLSEILESTNELTDKVWYNRHKYREYQIHNGEIKLIENKDFTIENSQRTIVREIWEGAKKSAKKMEKQFGKKALGPWDDFEWGMINGKLSALRWVIGEDWDE